MPRLFYPQGKYLFCQTVRKLCPQNSTGRGCGENKNLRIYSESTPQYSCHPSFQLATISIEVSHLLSVNIIGTRPNERLIKTVEITNEYVGTIGKNRDL
jgi:hypothetical protein